MLRPKINQKEERSVSSMRIYAVLMVILLTGGLVFLRLYVLQVSAHDEYAGYAENQHTLKETIKPLRGKIFLRDKGQNFPVAVNKEMMTAFAIPDEISAKESVASEVSDVLELDFKDVLAKISKQNDLYEVLKRKLSQEESDKIEQLNLEGIHLESQHWRYYPGEQIAAQVVGFVGYQGDEIRGQYGIESYFENNLKGANGFLEQERDTFGRWISVGAKTFVPQRNGDNIILTLDHVLQFKAEIALQNAVERHGADSGKVLIIEPSTGKILAMAVYPTFNLNSYWENDDMSLFKNSTISDSFECGSVFKSITMAAGLDMEKVNPDTEYVDNGYVSEAGYVIKNSDGKTNGRQTMTQVIEKSLNTGAIYVEKEVGNQQFYKYVRDFGFGKKTGIEIPGEVSGDISNLETGRDINFYTASFGQGISVTPLQLTMAYTALANGGELLKPQIVDEIVSSDGTKKEYPSKKVRSVISRRAANQMTMMLESNVKNGHGKLAGVPGYRVAGKTGTAQIPDKEKGGYLEDATVGSFAGYGPVENPAYVMVVIIDYPKDVEWAESTAAPVFGELTKFIFDHMGIEPTEEYTPQDMEKFSKTHNYLAPPEEKKDDKEKTENSEKEEQDDD